jgi:pyruvate dehydrogenase E1 component beta subunit
VNICKEVVRTLNGEGISVELIDLRSIKPLDTPTLLKSLKKTGRCVIVEEGHYFTGIAAEIGFELMEFGFNYLDAPIARVCQRETPLAYSKVLEAQALPNPERILDTIRRTLKG